MGDEAVRSSTAQVPAWLLSSAGVSALLVAFGYLVEAARDHLLGVELRGNVALAEYGLVGARFIVNVITLGFRWIGLHPVITGGLIVLALAIAFFVARRRLTVELTPQKILLRFMIILLLLLGKAAFLDVPAALIENVLIDRTDPKRAFDAAPFLVGRTTALWTTVICAHAKQTRDAGLRCGSGASAQRELEGLFLFNGIATLILLVWTLSLSLPVTLDVIDRQWRTVLVAVRAVTWTALMVAVVALPYHYGKLVAPTRFREVVVNFKSVARGAPAPIVVAPPLPPPETDRTDSGSGDPREELTKPALLLTANASVLTLYYRSDDLVRELSRSDVESITVYPAVDVLQVHMDRCLSKGVPE
jgi:hypothetical protein